MMLRILLPCFLVFNVVAFGQMFPDLERSALLYFETEKFEPIVGEWKKLDDKLDKIGLGQIERVEVIGTCDDRGSSSFNQSLSLWRARTVRTYLIQQGVPEKDIHYSADGEIPLLEKEEMSVDEQRKNNRSVSVTFSLKPQTDVVEEEKPMEPITPSKPKPQQIFSENSKVGDKIILENILFEGGRHFILPESEDEVKNLLQTLKMNPKYSVIILGHICCETNGRDGYDYDTGKYNLSEERAHVIYKYLIANGIDKKRLDYKGMKSDYKLGKGDKFDRRVEIEITHIAP